jgi:hypothetical protein
VQETSDGGYILAGNTEVVPGNLDAYLVRTLRSGDTVWTRNYDLGEDEALYRVIETPDLGFVCAGWTSSAGSPGSTDVFVMKVDEDGDGEWKYFYMGLGNNIGFDMCATGDGNYVITGYTEAGADPGEVFLLKIDGDTGDSLWAKTYGGSTWDYGHGITETPDGGLVVVGAKSNSPSWARGYMIRTDGAGDTLWTREYGIGGGHIRLGDIDVTPDYGYICVGFIDSTGAGDLDFYFLKTDQKGMVHWSRSWGKEIRERLESVVIADDLGYVAAGYNHNYPGQDFDIYIVKLEGDDAGVEPIEQASMPGLLVLEGASPFTSDVVIRYEIPAAAQVRLAVYDVAGRHVRTLSDGRLGAGTYRTSWDLTSDRAEKVPSGVYFIKCETPGRSAVEKALVIR